MCPQHVCRKRFWHVTKRDLSGMGNYISWACVGYHLTPGKPVYRNSAVDRHQRAWRVIFTASPRLTQKLRNDGESAPVHDSVPSPRCAPGRPYPCIWTITTSSLCASPVWQPKQLTSLRIRSHASWPPAVCTNLALCTAWKAEKKHAPGTHVISGLRAIFDLRHAPARRQRRNGRVLSGSCRTRLRCGTDGMRQRLVWLVPQHPLTGSV